MKAAVDSGRPPTALLLGKRRKKWNRWDDKLLLAHYLLTDFEVEGWPIWVDTSERVEFQVKKRNSRSGAAIERVQWQAEKTRANKKGDTPPPFGERLYAVPKTIDGKPLPRKRDWLEEQTAAKTSDTTRVADPDKMAEYRNRKRGRKDD